jgi:hypothetical protein
MEAAVIDARVAVRDAVAQPGGGAQAVRQVTVDRSVFSDLSSPGGAGSPPR